jgi:signal transduction histidine kinase
MVRSGADSTGRDWAGASRSAVRLAVIGLPVLLVLAVTIWLSLPLLRAFGSGPDPDRTVWLRAAPDGLTRLPHAREPLRPASGPGGLAPSGSRQYGLVFDRTEVPGGDLAVYAPRGGGGSLFANRVPLPGEDVTPTPSPVLLDRGGLAPFPRAHLHPGPNRADLVADAGTATSWPQGLLFGPAAALAEAHKRQAMIQSRLPRLALLIGAAALLAALCLALLQPGRGRWQTWRPSAFTGLATLLATLPLQAEAGFSAPILWAQADLLPVALSLFLAAWLPGEAAGRLTRNLTQACALGLIAVALVHLPMAGFADRAGLAAVLSLLIAGTATAAAVWKTVRHPPASLATVSGVSLAVLWFLAIVLCRSTLLPLAGTLLAETVAALSAPLLLAGGLVILVDRWLGDAAALWDRRRGLSRLVREQEIRIGEQEAIIGRELQRRAVLEERERLTRDIHDGIGGQLLSLLVRVRSGKINQTDLEAEVQSSLNDLRLIVDSLDHAAESFPAALSVVHSRLRPQLESAGIALDWRQDDRALPELLDARTALNIFRIFQETFANVLKHAGATRVEVNIGAASAGEGLAIIITDNGRGMGAGSPRPRGRGLGNMRQRALSLGANLDIAPGPDGKGVVIRLEIPPRADEVA